MIRYHYRDYNIRYMVSVHDSVLAITAGKPKFCYHTSLFAFQEITVRIGTNRPKNQHNKLLLLWLSCISWFPTGLIIWLTSLVNISLNIIIISSNFPCEVLLAVPVTNEWIQNSILCCSQTLLNRVFPILYLKLD